MSEHKHAERVYFKVTGLSGSDDDHFQPRMDGYVRKPTTWRMRRLTSIMKELGHPQVCVCLCLCVCVCVCVCVPTGVKYLLYVTFEMSDAGLCLVHSWYWPNLAKIYT